MRSLLKPIWLFIRRYGRIEDGPHKHRTDFFFKVSSRRNGESITSSKSLRLCNEMRTAVSKHLTPLVVLAWSPQRLLGSSSHNIASCQDVDENTTALAFQPWAAASCRKQLQYLSQERSHLLQLQCFASTPRLVQIEPIFLTGRSLRNASLKKETSAEQGKMFVLLISSQLTKAR